MPRQLKRIAKWDACHRNATLSTATFRLADETLTAAEIKQIIDGHLIRLCIWLEKPETAPVCVHVRQRDKRVFGRLNRKRQADVQERNEKKKDEPPGFQTGMSCSLSPIINHHHSMQELYSNLQHNRSSHELSLENVGFTDADVRCLIGTRIKQLAHDCPLLATKYIQMVSGLTSATALRVSSSFAKYFTQ